MAMNSVCKWQFATCVSLVFRMHPELSQPSQPFVSTKRHIDAERFGNMRAVSKIKGTAILHFFLTSLRMMQITVGN